MPSECMTRNAVKMRLCRFASARVNPFSANGIEKVRGSTPLISTNREGRESGLFCFMRSVALRIEIDAVFEVRFEV